MPTHRISKAIVCSGELHLTGLPFADGESVEVVLTDNEPIYSIDEARALLRGNFEGLVDPAEPMIPVENWEMLK